MEEREKRRIGEQIEPGGRAKAPGRLELLQRFINTYNHDFPPDWDRLGTKGKAQAWLRDKGLLGSGAHVSDADATRLRELREAIRELVIANHGEPAAPETSSILRAISDQAPLRVVVDGGGRTELAPAAGGADGVAATLLGILHEAQLSGDWSRLKGCRQCGYAFYDRSKNRSGTWCAMSICGNRTKNRAYYRRRRGKEA
jgi:predicted RNA-binding Zn ribbon-like protein